MKIKNAFLWRNYTVPQAWLVSALILSVAFGLRYMLQPIVAPYGVFYTFTVACLMIQYLFGYKFSAPAIIISTLIGEYYFVEPYGTFDVIGHKDMVIAAQFLMVTGIAVFFMERLSRQAYAADLLLKVMASRHKTSLLRENDRIFYAKKSSDIWAILEELVMDYEVTLFFVYGTSEYKLRPLFYKLATRFKLTDADDQWSIGIHPDDLLPLQTSIANGHGSNNSGLNVRLIRENGSEHSVSVVVDHFQFMGKRLSVVKLDPSAMTSSC